MTTLHVSYSVTDDCILVNDDGSINYNDDYFNMT